MGTNYGADDARKAIALYGPELELMARATLAEYPHWRPVGAAIFEDGCFEFRNQAGLADAKVPVRRVEDGLSLVVMPQSKLRQLLEEGEPRLLPEWDRLRELQGPGEGLPILAACRAGMLLGLRPLAAGM